MKKSSKSAIEFGTSAEFSKALMVEVTSRLGEQPIAADKFTYSGIANIDGLQTKKVGDDDDKKLEVSLKFSIRAAHEFWRYFDAELGKCLHIADGAMAVRNRLIDPIRFVHNLTGYRLTIAGSTHTAVKLKGFTLEALDGGFVLLGLSATFNPTGNEVAVIAEYLSEQVNIMLTPETADLFAPSDVQ